MAEIITEKELAIICEKQCTRMCKNVYCEKQLQAQDAKTAKYYESVVIPQKVAEAKKELIEKIGKIATFDKECSHTICSAEKYEEPCNLESYCPYRIWQQLKKDEEIE